MPQLIQLIHGVFGLLFWGTGTPARYLFVIIMSIISAAGALILFRALSRQERIAALRKRIRGTILQIHLYPDRFDILVGSLAGVLADTTRTIKESIIPLAVISLPIALVMLEVDTYCGSSPLGDGESFTIRVRAADESGTAEEIALDDISIEVSPDIALETGALREPDKREIFWRARVDVSREQTGSFVRIRGDGTSSVAEKRIAAGVFPKRLGSKTVVWSFPGGITGGAEGYLQPDVPVSLIEVSYKRAGYRFFFWDVDALVLYVILTLVAAFAVRPFFRVHF